MTLNSMTGYGRAEGAYKDWSWVWEVRSVNGKNLDMRLRLPPGFESLDPQIRKAVSKALNRGNLQISLAINSAGGEGSFSVNENLLQKLIDIGGPYVEAGQVKPPRLDGLYQVRGVVNEDMATASDPALKPRNTAILQSLDEMLAGLKRARAEEGQALDTVLGDCVDSLEKLIANARNCKGSQAGQIKSDLERKFKDLLGEKLPEDKLIAEAALLALKADIREELDRLDAHTAQAKSLLATGYPVGRKLDFLCQEFIREINTLCSKSTDIDLTQVGLEMKSVVEQLREQAANVE